MPAEQSDQPEITVEVMSAAFEVEETTPVFVISVAAQLAGMHPQTLRQYDRLGLVSPGRTAGRGRRYSARDVAESSALREHIRTVVRQAGLWEIYEPSVKLYVDRLLK